MKQTQRPSPGFRHAGFLLAALFLGACAGDYSGEADGRGAGNPNPGGGSSFTSVDGFYAARIEPRLAFCRTCHVPGGVADVDDGRLLMLGSTPTDDLALLRASWAALGGNNPVSRILLMPSQQDSKAHSGGYPWPQNSAAYKDMAVLLRCFEAPAGCLAGVSDGPPLAQEQPLLGSKRAAHVWETFCADQDDAAMLPPDPRSLVQAGLIASDRAVYFNAYWQDCHAHLPEAERQARTCGEYRARRDRGRHFLLDELPETSPISAADYNNTWTKWGLSERPAEFDAMYTLRYGLNAAPFDNPYPLPGEDPNATAGGSGQLPLGLRQMRDEQGHWTGMIGSGACFLCHGGQIGDPRAGDDIAGLESLGIGNANYDVLAAAQDASPFAATPLGPLLPALDANSLFNIGIKQRGQNNAVGAFELLVTLLDFDSLGFTPNPLKVLTIGGPTSVLDLPHPLAHTQDTPAWWNTGSRPRKFFDAGVSNDSTRIIMAAGPGELSILFNPQGTPYRERIERHDQDLEAFFLSLRSPPYPREIDTALAEQGAILFHTKDLWAVAANAEAPQPLGGNGSCASCHGAYSPRYVNDPAYLPTPALEGVAGHIAPLAVIGTDRARSDMLTPTLRRGWAKTFWGYPDNLPGWIAPEDKDPLTEAADDVSPLRIEGVCGWEQGVIGYQAPPLYGIWATAPYLHNGSVPTLEQLLDSTQRPPLWRRQLQTLGGVSGYDQRLGAAYDFARVGWKHEVLGCADIPGTLLLNCNPVADEGPSLLQLAQNLLNQSFPYAGVVLVPDPQPGALDKRFVYDTRILGNGNGGHAFSDALTPRERRALIEYLKTL